MSFMREGTKRKGSRKKTSRKGYKLPTKANEPSEKIDDYTWIIYGEKGIGKSTLAMGFPNIIAHFMWEPGRYDLKSPLIPEKGEQSLNWERYQTYLEMIEEQHGGKKVPGRILVDTLDGAAKACERFHASKLGKTSLLGVKDHGRAWDECITDWNNTHNALIWSGFTFTFLSHSRWRPKDIKGVDREEVAQLLAEGIIVNERQPTARPWSVGWIKQSTAYAVYYGWEGTERVLWVRGTGDIFTSVANSEDHFRTPRGKKRAGQPYEMIPMGSSPKESYQNLLKGWNNKIEGYFADELEEE